MSETVGARLTRLRLDQDVSQRALAEAAGVSNGYIARIERGGAEPEIRVIRKIARALGVTPHYLETGDRHGLYVYVTKDDLIEAAQSGEGLARHLALENGVMVG